MAAKIVCVVGPTASGKTKMGVELAKAFHGEVVSVDSMQVYRGMTVGTAAPTPEEMEGIPHHMIAVADPSESWSVARFTEAADRCIQEILARGRLPILVGGTGLYLDALVRGNTFAPGSQDGAVRRQLQRKASFFADNFFAVKFHDFRVNQNDRIFLIAFNIAIDNDNTL